MSPDEVALRSFPELHWDEGVNLDGSRVVIHIQNRIKKHNAYISGKVSICFKCSLQTVCPNLAV